MVLGAQAVVKEKKAGAVISAGNTGALLATGSLRGRTKGVGTSVLCPTMPRVLPVNL